MNKALILQPFAVVMLLTFIVWLRLFMTRVPAMRRQRLHPQKVATRVQKASVHISDAEARSSDNFMNLFELPVIFYALCLALHVTDGVDAVHVGLAWAFASLRILHSAIHLSYNTVMHRFLAYAAGGVVLFAMVVHFSTQALL